MHLLPVTRKEENRRRRTTSNQTAAAAAAAALNEQSLSLRNFLKEKYEQSFKKDEHDIFLYITFQMALLSTDAHMTSSHISDFLCELRYQHEHQQRTE